MKAHLIFFLVVFFHLQAGAQGNRQDRADRVHAAKIAYITARLELNSTQAGQFVPLYTEYENELKGIRQAFMKKYSGNDQPDNDPASRQYIEDDLDYQQQIVDLKRKYNGRFLKIISATQLAELYVAERDFKRLLLQRLQNGDRNSRGDRHPMRR